MRGFFKITTRRSSPILLRDCKEKITGNSFCTQNRSNNKGERKVKDFSDVSKYKSLSAHLKQNKHNSFKNNQQIIENEDYAPEINRVNEQTISIDNFQFNGVITDTQFKKQLFNIFIKYLNHYYRFNSPNFNKLISNQLLISTLPQRMNPFLSNSISALLQHNQIGISQNILQNLREEMKNSEKSKRILNFAIIMKHSNLSHTTVLSLLISNFISQNQEILSTFFDQIPVVYIYYFYLKSQPFSSDLKSNLELALSKIPHMKLSFVQVKSLDQNENETEVYNLCKESDIPFLLLPENLTDHLEDAMIWLKSKDTSSLMSDCSMKIYSSSFIHLKPFYAINEESIWKTFEHSFKSLSKIILSSKRKIDYLIPYLNKVNLQKNELFQLIRIAQNIAEDRDTFVNKSIEKNLSLYLSYKHGYFVVNTKQKLNQRLLQTSCKFQIAILLRDISVLILGGERGESLNNYLEFISNLWKYSVTNVKSQNGVSFGYVYSTNQIFIYPSSKELDDSNEKVMLKLKSLDWTFSRFWLLNLLQNNQKSKREIKSKENYHDEEPFVFEKKSRDYFYQYGENITQILFKDKTSNSVNWDRSEKIYYHPIYRKPQNYFERTILPVIDNPNILNLYHSSVSFKKDLIENNMALMCVRKINENDWDFLTNIKDDKVFFDENLFVSGAIKEQPIFVQGNIIYAMPSLSKIYCDHFHYYAIFHPFLRL